VEKVTSKDGTVIAYERSGAGPAVILVDGALCSRAFGPTAKLAPLLAEHFTVFAYDRRGRGGSGDVQPYSKAREIEDIAALNRVAGGSASLLGLSSGAALALEAAAAGLGIRKVVAYEPPYVGQDSKAGASYEGTLKKLIGEGRRGEAVKYFMRDMVQVPGIFVVLMQLMFGVWGKLKAVAHTLPYDAAVMGDFTVPSSRLRTIQTPALVMNGSKTDARLKRAAQAVAAALPNAKHVVLACYECETLKEVFPKTGEGVRWCHINQIDFTSTLPGTKEFVSLAVENEWFDRLYIEFESVDSAANTSKRFTVATQPTLYSRYGLVKYWGRVGVFPRTRTEAFGSPAELDAHIFETARRRLALGYCITVAKGPDQPHNVLGRIIELARQRGEYCPRLQ